MNNFADEMEGQNCANLLIVQDKTDSHYLLKMPIDPAFYKFLIGKKRATLNKLESETGIIKNFNLKFI